MYYTRSLVMATQQKHLFSIMIPYYYCMQLKSLSSLPLSLPFYPLSVFLSPSFSLSFSHLLLSFLPVIALTEPVTELWESVEVLWVILIPVFYLVEVQDCIDFHGLSVTLPDFTVWLNIFVHLYPQCILLIFISFIINLKW